jgi:type II secretory pathway component PulM
MIRGGSAQLEALRERIAGWAAQLSARDRRALLVGAVAVTVLPLLALSWHVTERNSAAQTRIAEKRSVLRQWSLQQPQWQARGLAATPVDLSLQQRVEAARNAAGIVADAIGVTEQTSRTVQLQLNAVDFASTVAMLGQMSAEGVSIESVELNAALNPGAVSGTALLRGP